jgi:hypothetical protein
MSYPITFDMGRRLLSPTINLSQSRLLIQQLKWSNENDRRSRKCEPLAKVILLVAKAL